jgi:DNA-binding transcriptional ArsR family regulator
MANLSTALAALGDPTRRAIFERVAERPAAVGEIALAVPVSRPAVSQHLRILKDAGLVADRRVGTRRIYRIEPQGISELRAYFEGFWSQALDAFRRAAEEPGRPPGRHPPSTMNQTDQEEA